MIQRIQTIFLFLVAVCAVMFTLMPLWEEVVVPGVQVLHHTAFGLKSYMALPGVAVQDAEGTTLKNTVYLAALAWSVAAMALFSISRYNNRMLQMKIGLFNSLAMTGLLVAVVLLLLDAEKVNPSPTESMGDHLKLGFFTIPAAMFFNLLANRFIRHDEKLVRSADRLR